MSIKLKSKRNKFKFNTHKTTIILKKKKIYLNLLIIQKINNSQLNNTNKNYTPTKSKNKILNKICLNVHKNSKILNSYKIKRIFNQVIVFYNFKKI